MSDARRQRVLTICGSLRRGSLNRALAAALPELAPERMDITAAPAIGELPLYNADLQTQGFPAPASHLAEAVRAADGVVIVTPEYNYSVPGVLKNAIDWLSRLPDQPFAGKPVALQSAAIGMLGGARAQYHLRQMLVFLDAYVFNRPEVFVTHANTKIDEATGTLTDQPTRDIVKTQLAGFAAFIDQLNRR